MALAMKLVQTYDGTDNNSQQVPLTHMYTPLSQVTRHLYAAVPQAGRGPIHFKRIEAGNRLLSLKQSRSPFILLACPFSFLILLIACTIMLSAFSVPSSLLMDAYNKGA